MNLSRFLYTPGAVGIEHPAVFGRAQVRRDADHAVGTERQTRQKEVIVAGPHRGPLARPRKNHANLLEVAARFFHTREIGVAARQLEERIGQHIRSGPAGCCRRQPATALPARSRRNAEAFRSASACCSRERRRRIASTPATSASRTAATDSCVALVPAFATTTAAFPTASFTAVHRATRSRGSSVCPSPVETRHDETVVPAVDQPARQALYFLVERVILIERRHHCRKNRAEVHETFSPLPSSNCSWTAISARVT